MAGLQQAGPGQGDEDQTAPGSRSGDTSRPKIANGGETAIPKELSETIDGTHKPATELYENGRATSIARNRSAVAEINVLTTRVFLDRIERRARRSDLLEPVIYFSVMQMQTLMLTQGVSVALMGVMTAFSASAADLRIDSLSCRPSAAGQLVLVKLTNISDQTLQKLTVKMTFSDGTDHYAGYAEARQDYVLPGLHATFTAYGDGWAGIATVDLTVIFSSGELVETSGIIKASCCPGHSN